MSTTYSGIENELQKGGCILHRIQGVSMMPLLRQNKDSVVIQPLYEKVKINDVILYRRHGVYILHRVIGFAGDRPVVRGDNCISKEYDITQDKICGVMTSFFREDVSIDCKTDKRYKIYIFLRPVICFVNRIILHSKYIFGTIERKIKKLLHI